MATTIQPVEIIGARDHVILSVSGTVGALSDTFGDTLNLDAIQSVAVQISGNLVGTITFQVSNDKTNWLTKTLYTPAGASATAPTGAGIWIGDLGARYFRANVTAYTSGTANITLYGTSESQNSGVSSVAVAGNVATTMAASATGSPVKLEDAVHASGDAGVLTLGVRVPTTPAAATSAAGDYGSVAIDSEGKQLLSGQGAPETSWASHTALTTTSDVSVKVAGAAGIRNYITDIQIDNTGASPVRVILRDGTTNIWSATVPANASYDSQLKTPIRGTAATVVNAQLGAAGTATLTLAGFIGV